jgi:Tol biopolymer transport system component
VNGVLAYRSDVSALNRLTWFDRDGKVLGYASDPGTFNTLALSPDGSRVAAARTDQQTGNTDIWIIDLARGASTRFTFDPSLDSNAVWSPDGQRIVFSSTRDGVWNLFQKDSSGAHSEEALLKTSANKYPSDWSRDGRFLIYTEGSPKTGPDLWLLPMTGERKPVPFLQTPFREDQAQFSPDGHWVAYMSDATNQPEIYVRPFPPSEGNSGQWMISNGGGTQPRWRGDGKELFYLSGRKLMAVDISTTPTFQAGIPKPLFEAPIFPGTVPALHHWDVTPDGQRFLINVDAGGNTTPINIVVNWTEVLKK